MPMTIWQELSYTFQRLRKELVPQQQHRKPLTWSNVPAAFAYLVPFVFMAYLVRRRDTKTIRLLLLPTVVVMTIRGTFSYDWFVPEYYFYTWMRGLVGVVVIVMATDFALVTEGRFKVGERVLRPLYDTSSGNDGGEEPQTLPSRFLPPWIIDALEVAFALRGIGWDFGKGVHVPKDTRPLNDRGRFIRATAMEFLRTSLELEFLDTLLKLVPGIGTTKGGSIYFANLPLVPRYLVSTTITAFSGLFIITGFENLNAAMTLVGVGFLGQPPAIWPPLINNPWAAESLSDLWSRRWHQLLRRVFLVLGGIPGGWIAGRIGIVLGAFFASGLFHESGIWLVGRGIDHRVTFFFVMQGVLVLLEQLFRRITGRRVHGLWGRIWTYLNMLTWSQLCVDSWYTRGLGGTILVPPYLNPTRRLLLPLLHLLVPSYVA